MKATVIISNYFNKKYIEEAISSVIEQTYPDWNLIIIDDTNGADKLKGYRTKSIDKIKVVETDDIGLSALRMYGAELSDGEYILYLDADDKIHPTFLEKTVKLLDENPDIAVAYTDTQHFDGANTYWEQPEYSFYNLLIQNFMCACSLIRKNTLFAVGGYDLKNFNYWEDYEFWIALGAKGYYAKHIPEKLYYYRIHTESGMQSERNKVLSPFYKSYIISKFPVLYPAEWNKQAKEIISQYPSDFISWKPKQQEEYLKKKGIIKQ
jgi:glycosyltransferase involved in cell wall biosynthesis